MKTNTTPLKVAIVLPIFNVEKFLPECLDSILNQTYNNYTVFAINDGSTDQSTTILQAYASRDKRIFIVRQPNKGLAAARNHALSLIESDSSFDFVAFVDSDDVLDSEFLSAHIANLKDNHSDVSICGFLKLYDNHETRLQHAFAKQKQLNSTEFIELIFSYNDWGHACGAGGMVWKQLYKASVIRGLRFPENRNILEDEPYNTEVAQRANKFSYIPRSLYLYRQSGSSLCRDTNFKVRCFNGRKLCVENSLRLSQKASDIVLSALLDSIASLLKDGKHIPDIDKYQSRIYCARKSGQLKNKSFLIFQLFCNHPFLAKIYIYTRKFILKIKKFLGLRG